MTSQVEYRGVWKTPSALFECVNAGGWLVVNETVYGKGRPIKMNRPLIFCRIVLVLVQRHPCRHLVDAALHVLEQGGVFFKFGGLSGSGSFAFL